MKVKIRMRFLIIFALVRTKNGVTYIASLSLNLTDYRNVSLVRDLLKIWSRTSWRIRLPNEQNLTGRYMGTRCLMRDDVEISHRRKTEYRSNLANEPSQIGSSLR